MPIPRRVLAIDDNEFLPARFSPFAAENFRGVRLVRLKADTTGVVSGGLVVSGFSRTQHTAQTIGQ
ncbi:MAG: hypothetical protein DMF88_21475 [Acidobacteria bacterium]|nr:MAG: hypothetical protein DMF88_21475 [Acidobacteriota bacterium]